MKRTIEEKRENQRDRYWKNIENSRRKAREYYHIHVDRCRENSSRTTRTLNRKRRLDIISYLGGKCVKCGFSDWRALQIDHVNGGGSKERVATCGANMAGYYKRIKEDKTGRYQLLCANCNWIKKYENNETPPCRDH